MVERLVNELGPWIWWVAGFALLGAEVLVPGVFLVWIGIAALVIGVLSLLLWETSFWVWQLQLFSFAVVAVAAALGGRRIVARSANTSDEPFLNQRSMSLVGRTATLEEPIREGRGRIRLDDTTWSIEGPDLPAGTQVRIVSSSGRQLTIEAVN